MVLGEQDPIQIDESMKASLLHPRPRAGELAGFVANLSIDLPRYLDSLPVPWYTEASARPSRVVGAWALQGNQSPVQ